MLSPATTTSSGPALHAMGSSCAGCFQRITGRSLIALDTMWHPQCFRCSQCSLPIEAAAFGIREQKPCCEKCLKLASTASRGVSSPLAPSAIDPASFGCARCGKSISGASVKLGNRNWCKSCVQCSSCFLVVEPGHGFVDPSSGRILCDPCATKRRSKRIDCGGCGEGLTGKFVRADGRSFHRECLKCEVCQHQLKGGYAKIEDHLMCGECAAQSKNRKSTGMIPRSKPSAPPTAPSRPKFCPQCSTKTEADGMFCGECGFRIAK